MLDAASLAFAQQAYVKASTVDASDFFGANVALSADGSTLAVAAPLEDSAATGVGGNQADNSASASGAVFVFARTGTTWTQEAYIKASNTEANDQFGQAIAFSADGSTLAVGAFGEDSAAVGVGGNESDNSASESGAVYVFTRSGTTWTQQAYVKASNTNQADSFASSVALSSDGATLAVGARYEDSAATGVNGNDLDNTVMNSGAAYVFTRTGTTWAQQAYVKASNPDASDLYGWAIALSADGSTLAVTAIQESSSAMGVGGNDADNSTFDSGAVYVLTRSGTTWTQQAYVKASNPDVSDAFGEAISLSDDGSTLAVATYLEDSAATGVGGNQTDNSASNSGAVYLFMRAGTTWAQQAYVKASNTDVEDRFGYSVSLSGDGSTLVVGAPLEGSAATGVGGNQADNLAMSSGAAYTFIRTGTTWMQQAYVKASNTDANDVFGRSVACSQNASTIAVGAFREDSAATGIGGNQGDNAVMDSGAVYIFRAP